MNINTKPIAAVIGLMLFMVAITRLPVELGKGRDFLVGLFQIGVLAVFFIVLWNINKWVGLFLILAVVSRTVPTITLESQHALKMVLFGLGWYYFVYHYANEKLLMDVICVIAFAHFMATTIQYFKIPSLFSGAVCGLTFNPNEGSAMFALCFPAFLQEGRKRYLPIIPAGLLMIGSFGGVLAVAVGTLFYVCMLRYYWYAIIPVVLAVLFWVFIKNGDYKNRIDAWINFLNIYKENWKWGFGLGHWEVVSIALNKADKITGWTRTHNSFINGLVEMGIGFGILVIIYIADLFRRYIKKALIPFTALVVILICCSTNSMFRMNAANGIIAITWLAILEIKLRGDYEKL